MFCITDRGRDVYKVSKAR